MNVIWIVIFCVAVIGIASLGWGLWMDSHHGGTDNFDYVPAVVGGGFLVAGAAAAALIAGAYQLIWG